MPHPICLSRRCNISPSVHLNPSHPPPPQVVDFKHGTVWPVMVTSYETLRKHAADLAGCVDLLVCDEGHRCAS